MTSRARFFKGAVCAIAVGMMGAGFTAVPAGITPAHAQDYDDGDAFDQLGDYGDWVNHWRYGRVWVPRDVDDDWRPYSRGHWELTEAYGWYWDSEEPWGWATYHYGRWALDDDYGWIWVPGDQWGPAWVDWRQSDDQIGWAPLPPEVGWGGGGLAFGEVDLGSEHYRPAWCFVPLLHFHDRDVHRFLAPPSRNLTFINNTTRITNYTVVNNTVINRSVDPDRIAAVTHHEIRPVATSLTGQAPQGRAAAGGQALSVFRPQVKLSTRPVSPQAPVLQRGGFTAPVRAAAPAGPAPASAPPAPSNGAGVQKMQALQQHQAEEAKRLNDLHAQERANADAARNAELARRHQAEQAELQRIQQAQRSAAQNRAQIQAQQPQQRPAQPPQGQQHPQ